MKKIAVMILTCVLTASVLCACGSETQETGAVTLEKTKPNEDAGDAAEADRVDDESFETLQNAYEEVLNLYNTVVDFYDQDYVEADESVEDTLNGIKKTLDSIGERDQDSMTMEEALKLMNILDGHVATLDKCIDKLQSVDAGDAQVDDETFAILQDNYDELLELHNTIIDAYNSGQLKQSADVSKTLDDIADLINMIGEVERDGLTMNDVLDYQDYMLQAVETLNELLEYM